MLKHIIIGSVLAIISTQALAQDKPRNNAIKTNLFSPIVRTANFSYERKVGANTTVQLGAFYTGYKADELKLRGFGITPEFRYYPGAKGAMNGFYLAPFARYQRYTLTEGTNKGTLQTLGGGLLIGNQWIFSKAVTFDVFLGPSYNSGSVKVTDGQDVFDLPGGINGFGVRAGLTIGVAF